MLWNMYSWVDNTISTDNNKYFIFLDILPASKANESLYGFSEAKSFRTFRWITSHPTCYMLIICFRYGNIEDNASKRKYIHCFPWKQYLHIEKSGRTFPVVQCSSHALIIFQCQPVRIHVVSMKATYIRTIYISLLSTALIKTLPGVSECGNALCSCPQDEYQADRMFFFKMIETANHSPRTWISVSQGIECH